MPVRVELYNNVLDKMDKECLGWGDSDSMTVMNYTLELRNELVELLL